VNSVALALSEARRQGVNRLDAQLLLAHRLGRSRSWLIAHDDACLDSATEQAFRHDIEQRRAGVPVAYLVGTREFHGLQLAVTPAVLVPRPETELLVDWALELLTPNPAPRVADLGTGSGAIALALAHRRPDALVVASDCDAQSLAVAQGNGRSLGLAVQFECGSWWEALPGRRFDLVLSNPPYVAADDPHLAALENEPRHALTPGGDGLAALRAIIDGAPEHLLDGAWLLLEHGHEQGPAVRAMLDRCGFIGVQTRRDLAGLERCTGGCWRVGGGSPCAHSGSRATGTISA